MAETKGEAATDTVLAQDVRQFGRILDVLLVMTGVLVAIALLGEINRISLSFGVATIPVLWAFRLLHGRLSLSALQDLLLVYTFGVVCANLLLQPNPFTGAPGFLIAPAILGAILRRPLVSALGSGAVIGTWGGLRLQSGLSPLAASQETVGLAVPFILILLLPLLRHRDLVQMRLHERALADQHHTMVRLVDRVLDPVITLDAQRRIIACNPPAKVVLQAMGWEGRFATPLPPSAPAATLTHLLDEADADAAPVEGVDLVVGASLSRWQFTALAMRNAANAVQGYTLLGHPMPSLEVQNTVQQAKANLLNAVSHELNSPLTPVVLQLHLLETNALGPLTPGQANALDIIRRNVERVRSEHARLQAAAGGKVEDLHYPQP